MPTVTETPGRGFAHCINAHCSGNNQQEVPAVRVVTEMRFRDRDPSTPFPGVENSHETLRFASEEDRVCPACGRPREVSDQRRPVYQPLSAGLSGAPPTGFDQDALLHVEKFNPGNDPRVTELAGQVAELKALLETQNQKKDGS